MTASPALGLAGGGRVSKSRIESARMPTARSAAALALLGLVAAGCSSLQRVVVNKAGDALALEIVLDTARYLGIGTVSMMHAIDPSGIVLGGAMTFGGHATPLGRRFLATVKEEVVLRALPIPAAKTSIDFAMLGGDAGYIGVAGLARLDYRRQ